MWVDTSMKSTLCPSQKLLKGLKLRIIWQSNLVRFACSMSGDLISTTQKVSTPPALVVPIS